MIALASPPATDNAAPAATTDDDQRRVTELDADYLRLHSRTVRKLTASLHTLADDLRRNGRAGASEAQRAFIVRHVELLREAYLAGWDEGAVDYYGQVSRTPKKWAKRRGKPPTAQRVAARLQFYAPSVAKMAHEAMLAWEASQVSVVGATALSDASDSGMQLGYTQGSFNPGQPRGYHGRWIDTGASHEHEGEGGGRGGEGEGEGRSGLGHARSAKAEAMHQEAVTKRGGGKGRKPKGEGEPKPNAERAPKPTVEERAAARAAAKAQREAAKPAKESIHERAARLQREGRLPEETKPSEDVQPIRITNERINPFSHDADQLALLVHTYGEHQLGAVLTGSSRGTLRDFAEAAGVKASANNAETISRIVSKVTEGRYSANFPREAKVTTQSRTQRSPEEQAARAAARQKAQAAKAERAAQDEARRNALIPVHNMSGVRINPFASGREAVEQLRTIYGDHQLEAALGGHTRAWYKDALDDYGIKAGRNITETIKRIVATATTDAKGT